MTDAPIEPMDVVAPPARAGGRPRRRLMWVSILVLLVLAIGAGVAGGGYWYVKMRARASQSAVQAAVAKVYPAPTVSCIDVQPNASEWVCAAVYHAESECVVAKVALGGGITSYVARNRCTGMPALAGLLPTHVTARAVNADAVRVLHVQKAACVRVPKTKQRWACRPSPLTHGAKCVFIQDVDWAPWVAKSGGSWCVRVTQGKA